MASPVAATTCQTRRRTSARAVSAAWATRGASGGEKSVPREIHSSETLPESPTEPSSAVQPWSIEITVTISQKPSRSAEIGDEQLGHRVPQELDALGARDELDVVVLVTGPDEEAHRLEVHDLASGLRTAPAAARAR